MMMNIKICRCTLWLRFILSGIECKALSSGVESPTAVDDQSPERPDFGTILWREIFQHFANCAEPHVPIIRVQ